MGSYKEKLKELLEEYDVRDDEDMVEMAREAFDLGCREGKRKAMSGGYGMRDDDMFDDEDNFRRNWSRGGYGERDGNDGRGMDGDGFGERRGVKGTGPYAGEYRRRRRY